MWIYMQYYRIMMSGILCLRILKTVNIYILLHRPYSSSFTTDGPNSMWGLFILQRVYTINVIVESPRCASHYRFLVSAINDIYI